MAYAMFCFPWALLKVFCLWIKYILYTYSILRLFQNIFTCHVTFPKALDKMRRVAEDDHQIPTIAPTPHLASLETLITLLNGLYPNHNS